MGSSVLAASHLYMHRQSYVCRMLAAAVGYTADNRSSWTSIFADSTFRDVHFNKIVSTFLAWFRRIGMRARSWRAPPPPPISCHYADRKQLELNLISDLTDFMLRKCTVKVWLGTINHTNVYDKWFLCIYCCYFNSYYKQVSILMTS
jgi:hypothetical protein